MKILKHWLVIASLSLITAFTPAHAQIPVTDALSLAQQVQQVAAWAQQIQAMKDQITNQQQLYSSMNGARGIGQLLNNPALKNTLPPEWQQVYSAIQAGGYAGLTGTAKAIRDANAIYQCNTGTSEEIARCNRSLSKTAQDKAFANEAYAAAQRRLDNIQALMGQIDNATDPKQIQDLQVRMQAEQAMIQNEQTKLMMFKMMAESEDRLIAQQKQEVTMERWSRKTSVFDKLQPVDFGKRH